MSIIKLKGVSKFYHTKNTVSSGFSRINLELDMGEFVVITGESGSGKSTLLNVISGLDSYEEGEMYILGEETSHYTEEDYEKYRRKYIGNIFQNFNLVNSYTVYQNIELALILNGYKKSEVKNKVLDIIETVGLTKYKNTKASKLSGGQKQRVAIARALAKDTPIIVADEPTGNLDVKSAKSIMELLYKISKEKLVIIVTHNYEQVEKYATRRIQMHDGKITEDKEIKRCEKIAAKPIEYRDIRPFNKWVLGFRNTFNILSKFVLLFLVYFFLTTLVFSEYSNINKNIYEQDDTGYNYNFGDLSPNRVILNKKDKTSFTNEEISNLKNLDNISRLEENDLLLDKRYNLSNGDMYYDGKISDIKTIDHVDMGELPKDENEVVIATYDSDYYLMVYGEDIIGKTMTLYDDITGDTVKSNLIISGIIIKSDDEFNLFQSNEEFFVSESILNELRRGINISYSKTEIKINNHILTNNENAWFHIKPLSSLGEGYAYGYNDLNTYCDDYNCSWKTMNLGIDNNYYDANVNLTIRNYTTSDNFNYLTGLSNYEENQSTIFISEMDYKKLFETGTYQISVFLENTRESSRTLKELNDMGYNTLYMRNMLANELRELRGLVNIFRNVAFIIATIALFFISYFIIKIILKSRNIYFSTIRILGATKKVSKDLLTIELLFDINIAYFVFLCLVVLSKSGIIASDYISDMVTYFALKDYIIVYIVLTVMSLLISNRYAHKLFKSSVMNTYREEV